MKYINKIKFITIVALALVFSTQAYAKKKQPTVELPTEITMVVLDGDHLYRYRTEIADIIYKKLHIKMKFKCLSYDRFLVDEQRNNSDFYKGSPLLYVYYGSPTAILRSVFVNPITKKEEDYYKPVILARKDKDIKTLKDLEKAHFYYTDTNSASGYLYPKVFLNSNNVNIQKPFCNDNSPSAEDVYQYVSIGLWDGACSYYGLLQDDWNFKKNRNIKVFEVDDEIPMDPLWVNIDFYEKYPKLLEDIKTILIEYFKNNKRYKMVEADDSFYKGIKLKLRALEVYDGLDFTSFDEVVGFITKNDKKIEFILKYELHYLFVLFIIVCIVVVVVYFIFQNVLFEKYYEEHKSLNNKYNSLLKQLEEENDFNAKIQKIETELKTIFKDFERLANDNDMIKYIATGEFLYNKYKNTHALEASAIANCYVKAFERLVMISAFGLETFNKQDDIKVPDEQQNIQNKLDPRKILDNGIREIRIKANLSNKDYKSLQKCKSIRNKVAHLKPVLQEDVISIRKTLFGENSYTNGIIVKLAPFLF